MNSENRIRLGVNIDHAATIRQARGTAYPDMLAIAAACEAGGADGITLHLREDRRHIQDADVYALIDSLTTPMNLEMAVTDEMVEIASKVKPVECCLVPEKREELTTEGGLDVVRKQVEVESACAALAKVGVRVSLFIEPDKAQIKAASEVGAPVIELHTGTYANATEGSARDAELQRLKDAAEYAAGLGIVVNAGHGLDYTNVFPILQLPSLNELNIGHSIVARALFVGMQQATAEMRQCLDQVG